MTKPAQTPATHDTLNFLLVGVGGQGTILASDILAQVGLAAGMQVKQAEVHGMSQRGGSVTSHVRWGQTVYSPLVGAGDVDVLLAFEELEALRYLSHLRRNALAVINLERIVPVTVSSLGQHYPDETALRSAFASVTVHAVHVDGPGIARGLGDAKVANSVLLGALSALLEEQAGAPAVQGLTQVPEAIWLDVMAHRVPPKSVERNHRAFLAGRGAVAIPV
jgi:indolepyruvate ferredoxin oxidoreductase beta subunit